MYSFRDFPKSQFYSKYFSFRKEPTCAPQDFASRHKFTKDDLNKCADGDYFGIGNAQLPSSPLLMLDRIEDIRGSGGKFERGYALAELDLHPGHWFFKHHFIGDPIMPGCFLIESAWQLTGFYMAWSGNHGRARILDSGRTRFLEPVTEGKQTLSISVHIKKLLSKSNPICIADGEISSNGITKCRVEGIIVGLF